MKAIKKGEGKNTHVLQTFAVLKLRQLLRERLLSLATTNFQCESKCKC